MQSNIAGCKSLFSRVIIDAFKEALLSRTPIAPNKEVLEKRKKRNRKIRNIFLFTAKNFQYADENKLELSISLLEMLKSIYRIMDRDSIHKEEKSYYARLFLDDKNPDFVWYCTHIGIDAQNASDRMKKQIKLFDAGNENIYSKLKSTLDLPLTVFEA